MLILVVLPVVFCLLFVLDGGEGNKDPSVNDLVVSGSHRDLFCWMTNDVHTVESSEQAIILLETFTLIAEWKAFCSILRRVWCKQGLGLLPPTQL